MSHMKSIHSLPLILGAALLLLSASCNKLDGGRCGGDGEMSELRISVALPGAERTRTNYTDLLSAELGVRSTYVFVFDATSSTPSAQTLEAKSAPSMSFSTSSLTGEESISVKPGNKRVCVLMNVPSSLYSSISTYQDVLDIRYAMSNESVSGSSKYFQMAGTATATVAGSSSSVTVSCRRVVARVALRSVTNSLASSVTLNRAWLSNVAGDWCASDETTVSTWYNKQGRKDESSRKTAHVIDGSSYTASLPSFTYKSLSTALSSGSTYGSASSSPSVLLYCYPNPSSTDPDGFTSSFGGEYTVLVLDVTIGGVRQYYPVVLSTIKSGCSWAIEGNYAYTVDMNLTSLGSDDPNKPVTKASASVSVSIADWNPGPEYTPAI